MGFRAMRSTESYRPVASEQVQNKCYDGQKYQYMNKAARYVKGKKSY